MWSTHENPNALEPTFAHELTVRLAIIDYEAAARPSDDHGPEFFKHDLEFTIHTLTYREGTSTI